jgi:hypothetical protein
MPQLLSVKPRNDYAGEAVMQAAGMAIVLAIQPAGRGLK